MSEGGTPYVLYAFVTRRCKLIINLLNGNICQKNIYNQEQHYRGKGGEKREKRKKGKKEKRKKEKGKRKKEKGKRKKEKGKGKGKGKRKTEKGKKKRKDEEKWYLRYRCMYISMYSSLHR